MAKGDSLVLLSDYFYISIILLVVLLYAGYEDFTKRKITTVTFLAIDAGLLIYYMLTNFYVVIFLIPIISEFFLKKFSLFLYVLIIAPLLLSPSILIFSLTYSILLIKTFGLMVKNFGRGDVKVLQTIAIGIPFYPHLPILDSLFPPTFAIMLLASILGVVSTAIIYSRNREERAGGKFTSIPAENVRDKRKFWINGDRAIYKIPFVTYVAVGFAILFILSSLRLV